MAFPQHDLDRDMLKSMVIEGETFILARNGPESMDTDSECEDHGKSIAKLIESGEVNITRRFTRNAGGPYLWSTFIVEKNSTDISLSFESEEDFFKWCIETAHSFDHNACQDVKDVKLWLEGSPGALICHHREGSFDLTPETVARCLHVANVISASCFLFCLRIGTFEEANGSVIDKSRLTDHLSRVLDKWAWCGERCKDTFKKWIDYVQDEVESSEKEDALKLLYQWTLWPLQCVLDSVKGEIVGAPRHDYAKVKRVTEWGDEVCVFLEKLRGLFKTSDVAEFLYIAISDYHRHTADLHLILGNRMRAKELLEMLKSMLEEVMNDNLKVTRGGPGKIEYFNPGDISERVRCVLQILELEIDEGGNGVHGSNMKVLRSDIQISRLSESRSLQIEEELHRGSEDVETHKQDYIKFPHDQQLEIIIYLIENNRYSEAREVFKQIDLKHRTAELRAFLEFLNGPEIKFLLHRGISPEKLESLCERQELLLEVSEGLLDDRQLTAKLLQQYAKMMGIRSKGKYQKFMDDCRNSLEEESASSQSYLWLKEELNLQLTLPVPECIQAVVSCLRDPWESGEHKRDNLSDTLKTYRCWKRSIDIFSDLLQNWSTQGTSSEVEWLKLLESQKSVHDSILCFLFEILQMCWTIKRLLEGNDSGDDNGLKGLVGSNHSNLLIYQALVEAFITSALVWVERGRARTLLTQLGPWYNMRHGGGNPGFLKEELSKFDKDEQAALSSIRSCTSACKGKTLFIEYAIQASETYVEYFDTAPKAFMTNEQNEFTLCVHVSNTSCESNGPFDKQVEELLDKFYEKVKESRSGDVGELHRVLEKLYDLLIEPFSESAMFTHLDPKATIVFVPDKMLYRVPFALLRDKRSQKYLFQRHPIAISPSLRVLQHCERQLRELEKSPLKPDGCILAVGNVAYDDPLDLLPGTRKELQHLHSTFPGRVKTLEQKEATPGKFLELVQEASRSEEEHVFAFIHLGVHGHWTPKSKSDLGKDTDEEEKLHKTGSLRFAKPRTDTERSFKETTTGLSSCDMGTGQSQTAELEKELKSEAQSSSIGEIRHASAFGEVGAVSRAPEGYRSSSAGDMLSSEDIIKGGFQWRTRLVVLSACNTSRGQGYSDGEVNLPRAMMIAGVPAAVVSQWKISDVGSPRLIKAFYEHMQRGQDVATALQSAMLQLSSDPESANNIFEWGPFLVWGLPTVQLPKEMLTVIARKTLSAKRRVEMLRCEYNCFEPENAKAFFLNALEAVNNVLEAVYSEFAIEDEAIVDAIIAVQRLLYLSHGSHAYEELIQLAEELFMLLPFERLEKIELELENRTASDCNTMYKFRDIMMYTQVMNGNYLIALTYVDKMQPCKEHENTTNMPPIWDLNRAVILRLMGKYEEALRLFDVVLAHEEDLYECLIQTSYLKYLMEDRSAALEYARRAKKYENLEFNKPGYGAFVLGYKAIPDAYRQWLLNVVEDTGASSSCIWDLLPVQFPEEPTQMENANNQIELLRLKFSQCEDDTLKLESLKALNAVDDILASVDNACVLVKENMISAIIAIEHLLDFYRVPYISEEVIALGEKFYTILPFEQATNIELELEKCWSNPCMMFKFRLHRMYTLAMKGNYQIALEFANKMFEDTSQNVDRCGANEGLVRQEKAVILRLMGKYDEALTQFEEELAHGEDYDCLIQTSYLKHLMRDDKAALEYALRGKKLEDDYTRQKDMPGYGAFVLGNKALPHEYRQWLLNVKSY